MTGFEMRVKKHATTAEAPEIRRRDGANAGDARRSCACGGKRPERIQLVPVPGGDQDRGGCGGSGQAGTASGSQGDGQGWLCTAGSACTRVHTPPRDSRLRDGVRQKAQGVLLLQWCLFSLKNTLKIPPKLDAEPPSLVLANCIYAGIWVLLLKFMHAYLSICLPISIYVYISLSIYIKKTCK